MKSRPVYKVWGCWTVLFYFLFAACSSTPTTSPLENITVTATVPVEVAATPFDTESIVSAVQIRSNRVESIRQRHRFCINHALHDIDMSRHPAMD